MDSTIEHKMMMMIDDRQEYMDVELISEVSKDMRYNSFRIEI